MCEKKIKTIKNTLQQHYCYITQSGKNSDQRIINKTQNNTH